MSALVRLENVNFHRQNTIILDNINLNILPNDFLTIVGPNGAGKSSLLKCILGFYKPNTGNITFSKNINIGYMPQRLTFNQMMPMKVKDFLTLAHKITPALLEETSENTSTSSLLSASLHTLSGGQLQRVLLTRALLKEPNLLILDEPTQNLDIEGQLSFYKLLDKIYSQKKMSILMVSHDLHFVMKQSTQVICLFHHICCSGKPKMIADDPNFLNLFGEDMSRLLKIYKHDEAHHESEEHHYCHG